jgi:drug/metabolite transporter (DMT)-like permease
VTVLSISIIAGLASALFGAISNILAKVVMGFSHSRNYIAVNFAIIFLLLIPFAPFFFSLQFSLRALMLVFWAVFLDGLANYFYFKAFEINDSVTASVFLSLSPLFTLLLLPMVDVGQGQFVPIDGLGVLSIVLGIVLLNRELQSGITLSIRTYYFQALWVPMLASFLFGANIYLIKFIFDQDVANAFSYYFLRAFIIAVMMWAILRPNFDWVSRKRLGIAAGRSGLVILQWMMFLYALDRGQPVIVKAVSDTSPLFVLVFGFLFLKESFTWRKVIGAFFVIGGLGLLTI